MKSSLGRFGNVLNALFYIHTRRFEQIERRNIFRIFDFPYRFPSNATQTRLRRIVYFSWVIELRPLLRIDRDHERRVGGDNDMLLADCGASGASHLRCRP